MTDFKARMERDIALINSDLERRMAECAVPSRESEGFALMREAMEYSLYNGGKRIRPLLTLAFCDFCGGSREKAFAPAAGIEMIHTYSLIHDDLPCMDNDDMRRGKPSSHIRFGYANALLAGDSLLTMAFETVLTDSENDPAVKAECAAMLSRAAGPSGMIAGQVMDLANEGKQVGVDVLKATDARKTGELIRVACEMGCVVSGAGQQMREAARLYSEAIGLAFQIVDDILDVTSSAEVLGKPIGSDDENEKSTYVSLLGLEESRRYAAELTRQAKQAVAPFENSEFLIWLADYLCGRVN